MVPATRSIGEVTTSTSAQGALRRRARWTNWAGNQSCSPTAVVQPRHEDEIVALVQRAAAEGVRVKVVGAGHSFTGVACTDGYLLDLRHYRRVLAVDPATAQVTVQAGIRLWRPEPRARPHGLALENLGDIAYQTVAGATATATHGTGLRFGNLSTRIVGLRLVTGDGSIVEATAQQSPEVLDVARVGVGALGVVSTVTMPVRAGVPPARHRGGRAGRRGARALGRGDPRHDHFEFFWVPDTGWALTKRNQRTDGPPAPRPAGGPSATTPAVATSAFDLTCRAGRLHPALGRRVARAVPGTGDGTYTDDSDKVFASPRLVHFYEMEYAIPRPA